MVGSTLVSIVSNVKVSKNSWSSGANEEKTSPHIGQTFMYACVNFSVNL